MHLCPMVIPGLPPIPHVGGPVIAGAPNVLIGGKPSARVSDLCMCTPVGIPDPIVAGSATVLICGMLAARMGDSTGHGGVIVSGCPTVLIGDSGAGGSGGAGRKGMGQGKASLAMPEALASGQALRAPSRQAATLRRAAAQGAPFVELCRK